jgi:hypothetical protein
VKRAPQEIPRTDDKRSMVYVWARPALRAKFRADGRGSRWVRDLIRAQKSVPRAPVYENRTRANDYRALGIRVTAREQAIVQRRGAAWLRDLMEAAP